MLIILLDNLSKFISSQKTNSGEIIKKKTKTKKKQAQVTCITKVHNLIITCP